MSAETYEARVDRLEREITQAGHTILNGIKMRRDHPSYGYTKTALVADLNRLEGMLLAWLVITGRWDFPGAPTFAQAERDAISQRFGISTPSLRKLIKES